MTLTQEEMNNLLSLPDLKLLQGKRDYLILALLCKGISKPQIARLRAYDFTVEGDYLMFDKKKYKATLPLEVKIVWDAYIRSIIDRKGVEFVKSKPVLISFSTNKLKSDNLDFGVTPEAIQQIIEKYFNKAGIEKKPYTGLFKQSKPKIEKQSTSENKLSKKFIPKRAVRPHRGLSRKNKRYRMRKRYAHYKYRLVESCFCLDANFLTSEGFFKRGQGNLIWLYICKNEKDGFLGQAKIELIRSPYHNEMVIRIEPSVELWANPSTIRAIDKDCRLGGIRWCFFCPQCGKRVFTLFYYFAKGWWTYRVLACRKCHGLLYLSQMRGWQRIGAVEYSKNKQQYKVQKEIQLWKADSSI